MANTAASTLITRTLDNISRDSLQLTKSGVKLETRALDWLNHTMWRMARRHDFKEMYKRNTASTVDGQKTYTMPTNYKQIILITVRDGNNSIKLRQMSPREFNKRIPYPENETEGRPTVYIPFGNEFDLFEIPDAVYTMYMRTIQWPTTITSASSLIDYTPNKDDVIVAGMTAEAFDHIQQFGANTKYTTNFGTKWEQTFQSRLIRAILEDERRADYDPIAKGFDSSAYSYIGEYWNDPLIERNL